MFITYTMREVYQRLTAGESEWVVLGNFLNDWYDYHKQRRWQLLKEPLDVPADPTPDDLKWAVFCAASAEYFCAKYHVRRPAWVSNPLIARLPDPWYFPTPYPDTAEERERLRQETPEPFARRNIFCSKRIFANKYEMAEDLASRRSA